MQIFVIIIAVIAATIVTIQTGNIIFVGLFDPIEFLIANTVVGMSCSDAVLITINIAIEFETLSFFVFCFCKDFITFSPIGVAAFPSPKMFATIFIAISLFTSSFLFISGNKNFITGYNSFVSFSIKLVFVAICIIPFHKHIVPSKFIVKFIALSVLSNTDEFNLSKLPEKIAKEIFEFIKENKISIYNEKSGNGLVRHIIVKIGVKTNEAMCIIVINGKNIPKEKELVNTLTTKYKNIKSIVKNINTKNTNVILGNTNINSYGNGYIQDKLGNYTFNISPMSFYQVNPIQAEKLYNIGIERANLNKDEIAFDLYCGIGTISMFMSQYVKKVYGVEIVEEAIKMAKQNAKINHINNTEFLAGDVEIILDDLINKKEIKPDVIMVDPPRRGLDNTSIDNIVKIKPEKLIYISCNPATLVRDLAKLEKTYQIKFIKPVDMFPFTSHVECVAVLELKESTEK